MAQSSGSDAHRPDVRDHIGSTSSRATNTNHLTCTSSARQSTPKCGSILSQLLGMTLLERASWLESSRSWRIIRTNCEGRGMGSSTIDPPALAASVRVTGKVLEVILTDGRALSVPLDWYPRLAHGSPRERQHFRLLAGGHGIHWSELDEDISVSGLLAGLRSSESASSLNRWLAARRRPPNKALQPPSRRARQAKSTRKAHSARG